MAGIERCEGLTLIELLVVMAILAIIGVIAIPFYTDYVDEARIHTTRQNTEPLRLALEDYFLEETTYIVGDWIPSGANTLQTGALGWRPDGDSNQYRYNVVAGPTGDIATSYRLTVRSEDGSTTIRCDRNQPAGTFFCDSL